MSLSDQNRALVERMLPRIVDAHFITVGDRTLNALLDAARAEGAPAAEVGVSAEEHRQRGIRLIGVVENAGAYLCRAEKAEARVAELVAEIARLTEPRIEDLIADAFEAGCFAVQENYQPDPDPDFKEAALDYAASVISKRALSPPAAEGKEDHHCPTCGAGAETVHACRCTPAPAAEPVGDWVMVPREPTEAMTGAMAYRCSQDPGWTVGDAYRDALLAAPNPPEPVAISREEIEKLIYSALRNYQGATSWSLEERVAEREIIAKETAEAILSKLSGYPLVEGTKA